MKLKHPFPHLNCNFRIRENQRAKRVIMKVKPPREVALTIPLGYSPKLALRFAQEQEAWVAKQLEALKEKAAIKQPMITTESEFSTKYHRFVFMPHAKDELFVHIGKDATRLHFPQALQEDSELVQNLVQLALRETYRKEAKIHLPKRVEELAKMHGFQYNKVSIRDSKGRWGSCSGQKNISLSLSLMALPHHLIDYILLHELCHTVEMNHSPRFHQLLNKACGGQSKQLNAELRNYSTLG